MTRLVEAIVNGRPVEYRGNGRAQGIERFLPRAIKETYPAGEPIFAAGDPLANLRIMQEGVVKASFISSDGKILSWLAVGGTGETLLGTEGLAGSQQHESSAIALTDCRILCVSFDHIREQGRTNPELIWELARLIAYSTRAREELLPDLYFAKIIARTARVVFNRDEMFVQNKVKLTQELIAELLGVSRGAVNKAEQELTGLGLIRRVRCGRVEILEGKEKELVRVASGQKEVDLFPNPLQQKNGKKVVALPASK